MNNALDMLCQYLCLSILILEYLQDLAAYSHGIADLGRLKSIVMNSATNAWTNEDFHWVSRSEQFIPNFLNDVLDFFFADRIGLFLCKYSDIESSRSYSNLSTPLFNADTSVNLIAVDFGSLIIHSGKGVGSYLVVKNFFSLAEGLGRVLCKSGHDQCSIYQ
jgi:hypothetical protein